MARWGSGALRSDQRDDEHEAAEDGPYYESGSVPRIAGALLQAEDEKKDEVTHEEEGKDAGIESSTA